MKKGGNITTRKLKTVPGEPHVLMLCTVWLQIFIVENFVIFIIAYHIQGFFTPLNFHKLFWIREIKISRKNTWIREILNANIQFMKNS